MLRHVPLVAMLGVFCLLLDADAGDKTTDGKKPEEPAKLDAAGAAVEDLAMAFRLAEYGRSTKSPEALITAAGIFQRLAPPTQLQVEVKADDDSVIKPLMLPSFRDETDK